jgi:Bacterial archaeo-eukaryotic release factor family 7
MEEVHNFLRQVAAGPHEFLSDQDLPTVLVGLGEVVAAYRSVNSFLHVLDDEICTNPDGMPTE